MAVGPSPAEVTSEIIHHRGALCTPRNDSLASAKESQKPRREIFPRIPSGAELGVAFCLIHTRGAERQKKWKIILSNATPAKYWFAAKSEREFAWEIYLTLHKKKSARGSVGGGGKHRNNIISIIYWICRTTSNIFLSLLILCRLENSFFLFVFHHDRKNFPSTQIQDTCERSRDWRALLSRWASGFR